MNRHDIEQIKDYVMSRIKSGKNISVRSVGGNIIIDAKAGAGTTIPTKAKIEPVIEYVAELPDVLTAPGIRTVFWCSPETGVAILDEPGTGDDQVWTNAYPQLRWQPQDRYTPYSGIPGVLEDEGEGT